MVLQKKGPKEYLHLKEQMLKIIGLEDVTEQEREPARWVGTEVEVVGDYIGGVDVGIF